MSLEALDGWRMDGWPLGAGREVGVEVGAGAGVARSITGGGASCRTWLVAIHSCWTFSGLSLSAMP